jgi:tripartite-type tricarboxylate transporter receptor subunit TctC
MKKRLILIAAALGLAAGGAAAQSPYPQRSVTLVVPSRPAGPRT